MPGEGHKAHWKPSFFFDWQNRKFDFKGQRYKVFTFFEKQSFRFVNGREIKKNEKKIGFKIKKHSFFSFSLSFRQRKYVAFIFWRPSTINFHWRLLIINIFLTTLSSRSLTTVFNDPLLLSLTTDNDDPVYCWRQP